MFCEGDSELRHAKAPKAPYNIEHGSVCRHRRHSNDRPRHVGQLTVGRVTWHVGEYLASERHEYQLMKNGSINVDNIHNKKHKRKLYSYWESANSVVFPSAGSMLRSFWSLGL